MFDIKDGELAVKYARNIVDGVVKFKEVPKFNLSDIFKDKHGAFVTINSYPSHELRGCIGIPMPVMPLKKAIEEGARSATHDPRFPPLAEYELDDIIVEVTILGVPELIEIKSPDEYLQRIKIGRDGLIVEQGFFKGLLLPQVPVEYKWDKKTFLSHTCMKAGLPAESWKDEKTKIYKFTGQVFHEIEPRGEIKEKKLDGT